MLGKQRLQQSVRILHSSMELRLKNSANKIRHFIELTAIREPVKCPLLQQAPGCTCPGSGSHQITQETIITSGTVTTLTAPVFVYHNNTHSVGFFSTRLRNSINKYYNITCQTNCFFGDYKNVLHIVCLFVWSKNNK